MGYYYTYGATRQDIIDEVTRDENWIEPGNGAVRSVRTIAKSLRGRHLWAVREHCCDGVADRYIIVFILSGARNGWGYKPVSEDMGPCELTCPLSFLTLAPKPINQWSSEWRERVRAFHAAARSGRNAAKNVRIGQRVQLAEGWTQKQLTIVRTQPIVGRSPEGELFRVPARAFASATFMSEMA